MKANETFFFPSLFFSFSLFFLSLFLAARHCFLLVLSPPPLKRPFFSCQSKENSLIVDYIIFKTQGAKK